MTERIDPHTDLGYTSHEDEMQRRREIEEGVSVMPRRLSVGRVATRATRHWTPPGPERADDRNTGVGDPYPKPDQVRQNREAATNSDATQEMLHVMRIERIRRDGERNGLSLTEINSRIVKANDEALKKAARYRQEEAS